MKRIALFFAIASAFISCAPEVVVTPELDVLTDETELVFSSEEGKGMIEFSTNVDWTARIKESGEEPWCIVTPSKGKAGDMVMDVIYLENKNPDGRTATVVITAMDVTAELVLTQMQKDILVLTADREYAVPYQGQELDFKVTHNLNLEIKSDVDWITEVESKALEEKSVKFAVAPNTGEARIGKITFTAGPLKEEIVVNQDAWVLEYEVTPAEDKIFDPDGGEHKITVASNIDYTVRMDEADWLTMTVDGDEYTFTAKPNDGMSPRGVDVYVAPKSAKYVSLSKKINISQKGAGAKLDVSEIEKRITYAAQTFELSVDANVEYEMSYAKVVDGKYVAVPDSENWLSHTVSGNVYTFSVLENDSWVERSLMILFTPKDAAYADMVAVIPVYQYGHGFKMWSKAITSIEGYDPAQKLRFAVYGDKLLLANTDVVYLLDPATGEVESTIDMPAGMSAHNVLVDDAGNFMIAADAFFDKERDDIELVLYHVPDPMNPVPEKIFAYNIGNYYGSQAGNVRVKGDIKKNAVITAVVSDGQDGDNPEDGAVLMWEVTDGVCTDWKWTNVPYTAWSVASLCAYPAGNTLADGLFYIGYGGDYNLKYAAAPVMNPEKDEESGTFVQTTEWVTSYVTGSTWQENYNCMSTAEWNGGKYAAILMGCHFDYDDPDLLLLDIADPAAAKHIYTYSNPLDGRDGASWANLYWTGKGTFSDIILIPTEEALLMVAADSNYGTITCVAIM